MWKRIAMLWTMARVELRLLWRALRHPLAPAWLKWGTAGVALYLLSPVDLVPDFIPVAGLLDDIVLVPLAIRWLLNKLPQRLRDDIRPPAAASDHPLQKPETGQQHQHL
jgi:uncharacterized membrane protein YkvA (DUF1232 family)